MRVYHLHEQFTCEKKNSKFKGNLLKLFLIPIPTIVGLGQICNAQRLRPPHRIH